MKSTSKARAHLVEKTCRSFSSRREPASYLEELYRGEIYDEQKYGAAPNDEAEREAFKKDAQAAQQFLELANDY